MTRTVQRAPFWRQVNRFGVGILPVVLLLSVARAEPGAEVVLEWEPPTNNLDGSVLADLAGYRLHFGASGGGYTSVVDVGDATRVTVRGLAWGTTYRFAARAYAAGGEEGPFSNEVVWTSPESSGNVSALAALDFDGDGLSDAWEILHFGTTGAQHGGPDVDVDGDGRTNMEEFIAGTDPRDAQSVPALAITREGRIVLVSFSAPGTGSPEYKGLRRYVTLEFAPDPSTGPWTPLPGCDSVPATNQVIVRGFFPFLEPRYFRAAIRIE